MTDLSSPRGSSQARISEQQHRIHLSRDTESLAHRRFEATLLNSSLSRCRVSREHAFQSKSMVWKCSGVKRPERNTFDGLFLAYRNQGTSSFLNSRPDHYMYIRVCGGSLNEFPGPYAKVNLGSEVVSARCSVSESPKKYQIIVVLLGSDIWNMFSFSATVSQ